MLVSDRRVRAGSPVTVVKTIADNKRNCFASPSPKGDHSYAQKDDNNASIHPSRLGADDTHDRDETIRHIEFCDRQLDALDRQVRSLSVKTNWTYWHLGKAYEAFCVVSDNTDNWEERTCCPS